jgi:signal transduction histidine kinase/PAS domain-containing protein
VPPEAYAATYHLRTEDGAPFPNAELPLARAVQRGETVLDARWRIDRPDGTVVLAVGSARPVYGADGRQVGAVLTVRDDTARAAAEAARQERDALARELAEAFRQSPVSTVVYDPAGRVVAVNPAFEALWGVGIADLPADYTVLADPQLAAAGVLPLLGRAFGRDGAREAAGAGEPVTLPAIRYDVAGTAGRGHLLWTQGRAYPVRDATGAVERVILTHEDVTARYAAEAALREAVRTLEAQNAQLQDQQLELELTNQQLQEQAAELEAQADALHAATEALAQRTHEAERAGGRAAFLAEASRLLNASLDPAATLAQIAALAVPALADWCGVDLVDAATGALEQAAVAHADPARVAWARQVRRDYPPPPDAPMGVPAVVRTGRAEFYPEISDAMLVASARDAAHLALLRDVGITGAIVAPLTARGRTLGALSLVAAAPGRRFTPDDLALAEEVGRRAGLALDNARLHAAAQAARAEAETARAAAEAANQAKTAFLSTMSHELRTPLNAIAGYADLLALGVRGPVTEAQRQDLERLRRANQHLSGLVADVLNFARLEAGQVEYHCEAVPLARVVADLEALVGPQLAARGLTYAVASELAGGASDRAGDGPAPGPAPGASSSPVVWADAEKVRQVLLNLLANAGKFTEPGGRVTLGYEADAAAGVVRIRVRDTGRGIAPDQQARVFEPFVQVDRHRTHESQQGVGLGLAISRDLARGMGGDLTVESTPGIGSTFTLTLPTATVAPV